MHNPTNRATSGAGPTPGACAESPPGRGMSGGVRWPSGWDAVCPPHDRGASAGCPTAGRVATGHRPVLVRNRRGTPPPWVCANAAPHRRSEKGRIGSFCTMPWKMSSASARASEDKGGFRGDFREKARFRVGVGRQVLLRRDFRRQALEPGSHRAGSDEVRPEGGPIAKRTHSSRRCSSHNVCDEHPGRLRPRISSRPAPRALASRVRPAT